MTTQVVRPSLRARPGVSGRVLLALLVPMLGLLAVRQFGQASDGGGLADSLRTPPGVKFEPAVASAAITIDDAVRAAGGLPPDHALLVLMTNPNVGPGLSTSIGRDGLVRRPVYVLQYDQVPLPEYGPGADSSGDLAVGFAQVYVDAETGRVLYVTTFGDAP